MKKLNIIIPREHGGWAMVSIPFMIGMMRGKPHFMHLLLFLAWLFLYMSSYPLLQSLKKTAKRKVWIRWGVGYATFAVLCLIPVLLYLPALLWFGPVLLVLLMVNIWHVLHKSERALLNDVSAILLFCMGGAAAYLLGDGRWNLMMIEVILINFLYFTGTVFFVKSVFRERKNKRWTIYAKVYHILLLLVPFAAGYPWMTLAYLYPAWRTLVYSGKILRPMKVGIIEIIGSVQFLMLTLIVITST